MKHLHLKIDVVVLKAFIVHLQPLPHTFNSQRDINLVTAMHYPS